MSLARTDLGKIINAGNGSPATGPFTSSSFTPANNSLLVVEIFAQNDTGSAFAAADLALNSNTAGLVFTLRTEVVNTSGYGGGIRQYTAPVATGVAMTINVGTATNPYAICQTYAYYYTGYDTASPIGLILQDVSGPSSGGWTPSLGGTTAATSEVLAGVIGILNSGTGSYTPGTGWTELFDQCTTDYVIWQGQYKASSAISTVDWADLTVAGGYYINPMAVAIEVKAASISAVASLVKLPPGRAPGKQPPLGAFKQGIVSGLDVTIALTGQSATFGLGTLTPSSAILLTGQDATFSNGTLTPSLSMVLTGSAATFTAGSLLPSLSVALSGASANFSSGIIVPSLAMALSGQSAAFSTGAVVPNTSIATTGQAAIFAAGSLTPNLVIGLIGQSAAFSAGIVTATAGGDVTVALTGAQAVFTAGNMTGSSPSNAPINTRGFLVNIGTLMGIR